MKIAERVNLDIADLERDMPFLRQLGVTELGIMIRDWEPWFGPVKWHRTPGSGLRETEYFKLEDLIALRDWIAGYGLRLYSIMGLNFFNGPWARPGQPEHQRMLENIKKSIVNMGKAGITQFAGGSKGFAGASVKSPFGLNHWRTSTEVGRGGAKVVKFDHKLAAATPPAEIAPISRQQIWEDTAYFLEAVSPVAEEAGVILAHHPADPPVPVLRGVEKILCNVEDFDRLLSIYPGKSNGIIFCLGSFAQMMEPEAVYAAIRHFQGKIVEVHFRNVTGDLDAFVEVYPDEGKLDMLKAISTLKEVGYDGPVVVDHTPHGIDDSQYGHRGRAFAFGYMKGLLQAAGALS